MLNGSSERINKEAYANDIGKRVKSKCLTKPVKTSKRKNRMSNERHEGTKMGKRISNASRERSRREKCPLDRSHIRSRRYVNCMPKGRSKMSQRHGQAYIQRALIEITLEATAAS